MNLFNKFFFYFLAASFALGVASCSDDDDNGSSNTGGPGGPGGSNFGEVNITLSGDVTGELTGIAAFQLIDVAGIFQFWTFSFLDVSPQTFLIDLDYISESVGDPQPGPGTYNIGIDPNNPTGQYFTARLTLIEDEDFANAVEYSSFAYSGVGGTVTITSSTDQAIVGTFEFTGYEYDDQFVVLSTVGVTGEFSAVDVE